jgi:hypothetical protein
VRTTRAPAPTSQSFSVLVHDGRAEELGAGQDRGVGLEDDVGVDPGGRRVHHRHALLHPAGDDAAVELAAEVGQLGAVVGAGGLGDVVDEVGADGQPVLAGQADGVGQVVLALGVVVADPRQRALEELRVERQDPRVDLAHLALRRRRVLLLDDRLDVAIRVADDPAVAERILDQPGQDAHGALGGLVLRGEPRQ